MWDVGRKSTQLYGEMVEAQRSKDPERIRKAVEARRAFDAESHPTPFRSIDIENLDKRLNAIEERIGVPSKHDQGGDRLLLKRER